MPTTSTRPYVVKTSRAAVINPVYFATQTTGTPGVPPSLLRLVSSILWPLEPLADSPRNTAGGTPELAVTLGVAPAGAKAKADSGGPGTALEQQHGKDDAKAGAERRLDDQVRQAPVPLSLPQSLLLSASILCNGVAGGGERTEGGGGGAFSLSRSSDAGRCVFCWTRSDDVAVIVPTLDDSGLVLAAVLEGG